MKVKSIILWGQNSNPNGYKGLVFCRNNGWIMENMDKGLTVPKQIGVESLSENTPNDTEFIYPIC